VNPIALKKRFSIAGVVQAFIPRRCSGRPELSSKGRPARAGGPKGPHYAVMVVFLSASGALLQAGQQGQGQTPSPFPLSNPIRERGSSVTGAYEGWYRNKDGSVSVLVGYFNRNTKQELDIPIGPNNRIEPGGPDRGQPTHFLAGRQWGVFTFKAPADFATTKLTWTLVANGQTNVITFHMKPEWVIEPFEDAASKNTPPSIRFDPNGPAFTGPPAGIAATFTTQVAAPLALTAWVTDQPAKLNVATAQLTTAADAAALAALARGRGGAVGPPLPGITWSMFRGPAPVSFDNAKPPVDRGDGKSTATATFSAPGDYVLRLQANDQSGDGGGGFQCCWTNVHVAVTVRAK
jgi:hypothetical protein